MSRDPAYIAGHQAGALWMAVEVERRLQVAAGGGEVGRLGASIVRPVPTIAELRRYIRELASYPPAPEDAEDPLETLPSQRWHCAQQRRERLAALKRNGPSEPTDNKQQHIGSWCACCCVPCEKSNPFYPALDARRRQLFRLMGRKFHPRKAL